MKKAAASTISAHDQAIADIVQRQFTAPEELAHDIAAIGNAARLLMSSRLKWSTIVTLISISSKVPKKATEAVLQAAMRMEVDYLKPKKQ